MIFSELNSEPSQERFGKIIETWWNIYEQNSRMALEELAVLLLNSAGIQTDKFNISEFPDQNQRKQIFQYNADMSNAPVFDKYFRDPLKKFMNELFQKNFWALLKNESFINQFLIVIEVMRLSGWDSLRAVSFLSGMKILRQCYCLMALHSNETASVGRIEELWNKVHKCFFRYSLRDKSSYLRSIPLTELICWSKETPEVIIEDSISKHIVRGLKDSSIENCKYSLILCSTVFVKPLLVDKQQKLFENLIPELYIFLRTNRECAFLSLKIINLALRFLNVRIGIYEDLNFSMCLFSETKTILEEAKLYFYNTHLKNKFGADIILETLRFYKECPVKCHSKLVYSLITYLIGYTSWEDWEYCLKCSDNDVSDCLKTLYEYVNILKTDSANNVKGLDSPTVSKMMTEFTIFFSEQWIQLMDSEKVIINFSAQVSLLRLTTLFDASKLSRKALAEIINKSVNIFHQTQSFEVLKECLLTIQFLNSFNRNIKIEEKLVSQIITEFIEVIKIENVETRFLRWIHYKIVLVVKNYEHDYESLWTCLSCLLENNPEFQKIEVIISVLFHLLMKMVKMYIHLKSDTEMDNNDHVTVEENHFQVFILESRLSQWSNIVIRASSAFIKNTNIYLNERNNLLKLLIIPRLYGDLIRFSNITLLSGFSFRFTVQEMESYIICCTRVMQIDCRRNGAKNNPCCSLLRDYGKLTIYGNLSVAYLKYFIMKLEKINSHSMIIMDILNYLMNVEHNPVIALVLANGLIGIYNEKKDKHVKEESIKVNLKGILTFIFKNMENLEGKDYQKTGLHLYLYLKKLISEGYNVFSDILEMVKSTLCEEIKRRLTEENTFHNNW